jgi:hypothetical protein
MGIRKGEIGQSAPFSSLKQLGKPDLEKVSLRQDLQSLSAREQACPPLPTDS